MENWAQYSISWFTERETLRPQPPEKLDVPRKAIVSHQCSFPGSAGVGRSAGRDRRRRAPGRTAGGAVPTTCLLHSPLKLPVKVPRCAHWGRGELNAGPQIRVHLNPENGTLHGKRVFADVTKVPRGAPPRLPGWVDLNPEMSFFVGHRGGSTVAMEHLRAPHVQEPRRRGPAGLGGGWPCPERISSHQRAAPGTSTTCAEGSLRQGSPEQSKKNT